MQKFVLALTIAAALEAPLVLAADQNLTPVLQHYANLVRANYDDTLNSAQAMQRAIQAFLAAPSSATQKAAQDAWRAAREFYGQTEAFRFYGGPIDDEQGP